MPTFLDMKTNSHGELIYSESDICDLIMQGHSINAMSRLQIDNSVDLSTLAAMVENFPAFISYDSTVEQLSTKEFDRQKQNQWFMPDSYRTMDIVEHVLNLCNNDAELQRCGHELILYQERGLFDLLRYLKYLVDVMTEHGIIWGVGRGSSVASFVLYKLGVHRIDSMYYDLDPSEFLR